MNIHIDRDTKAGGIQADHVRKNLAGLLIGMGRYAEAEDILKGIDRRESVVVNNLSRILCLQGKIAEAFEIIERYFRGHIASAPGGSDVAADVQELFSRGLDCWMGLDRPSEEAIQFVTAYGRPVREMSPELWSAGCFSLGLHFLQERNDGHRALRCLDEVLALDPRDREAREARSEAFRKVAEKTAPARPGA